MAEQRVALVTGASSGIGDRTARRLAAQGLTVYGAARRVDAMAGLAADAGVHVVGLDLTDDSSVVAGVDRVLDEQGRLDVLVNNAGYGSYGAVEDVPLDEARRQFEVNLFGLARLVQLALPGMRERRSGTVVNVSSIGAKIYEPLGAWYHATKFAVEGFSDSLRLELAPFGIDVVIIEPGPIRTGWNAIARTSMVERSADGPYGDAARRLAAAFERIDSSGRSSGPQVVADVIGRAVAARRPRTRYPVGRGAGTIVGARRVLPDRAMDAVLRRALT